VSQQEPASTAERPVDPLFSHAASPFVRTSPPQQAPAFASPPAAGAETGFIPLTTWVTYKSQIQFGLAVLAYFMVLVGAVVTVSANPNVDWKYFVAFLPIVPAGIVIWLTVRALSRLDEVQKRTQMQAIGFALAATALITFGYGFLEGAGLPHLNWSWVLPLITALWGAGLAALALKYRLRR
jgi:hypothetical protein